MESSAAVVLEPSWVEFLEGVHGRSPHLLVNRGQGPLWVVVEATEAGRSVSSIVRVHPHKPVLLKPAAQLPLVLSVTPAPFHKPQADYKAARVPAFFRLRVWPVGSGRESKTDVGVTIRPALDGPPHPEPSRAAILADLANRGCSLPIDADEPILSDPI